MNDLIISLLSSVIAPALIAWVTARIGLASYSKQVKADLQKEFDSRFNVKKWEAYLGMNEIIQEIYYGKESSENNQTNLDDKINLLRTQVLLLGSKDVIEAFGTWRRIARERGEYDVFMKQELGRLIVEMRKDLGLQDNRLELGVMQDLFPRSR